MIPHMGLSIESVKEMNWWIVLLKTCLFFNLDLLRMCIDSVMESLQSMSGQFVSVTISERKAAVPHRRLSI